MSHEHDYIDDVPFPDDLVGGERGRLTMWGDIEKFALAGNATFTLVSLKSGDRYTFKVSRPNDFNPDRPIWFVSMLRGPNNENDFSYLGNIRFHAGKYEYEHGRKCRSMAVSNVFMWFWRHCQYSERDDVMDDLEVWHEGKCGRCGRKLTVPSSVESGFGPECINFV